MTTEAKGMLAPTVWPTKRVRQELMRPCRGCWKARKSLCSGAMEGMSLAMRAEVRRLQATRNFNKWKTQSHQGRVARATGMYLLSHCRDIRRLAFAARAPDMVLFLVLALCEWLPTRGRDSHRSERWRTEFVYGAHRAIDKLMVCSSVLVEWCAKQETQCGQDRGMSSARRRPATHSRMAVTKAVR